MKNKTINHVLTWPAAFTAWLLTSALCLPALAQSTAFTYQGRLNDGANPANGSYDLTFRVWNAASGPSQVGGMLTNAATAVTNGLFTVTVDFGNQFPGADRWLEIAVRTNGGGAFATLSPRQRLLPSPYAVTAGNLTGTLPVAQLSGTILSAQLGGTYSGAVTFNNAGNSFTGNGTGVTNVNAATLGGLNSSNFWQITGNTGTIPGTHFLGASDNHPLEIKVNNLRAIRLEPTVNDVLHSNILNVVAGSPANSVAGGIYGGTIAGGGARSYFGASFVFNQVTADFGTVGGGAGNTSSSLWATVGGGQQNTSSGSGATVAGGVGNFSTGSYSSVGGGIENSSSDAYSTVSGGLSNRSSNAYATVGGGVQNTSSQDYATVSGGHSNTSSGLFATVSGGSQNVSGGASAVVPGGFNNRATADNSFAAGRNARATHQGAVVWGDGETTTYSSDRVNQFKIQAGGGILMDVSGASGLTPAAFRVNSTSSSGVALFATQGSSDATAVLANSGAGDLIRGFSGPGAGNLVFQVVNNGGVFAPTFNPSDRNAKAGFEPVSSKTILELVAALPITRWHYTNDTAVRHIGPMAQDFYAAFRLGTDDKHIATVDADGVALAAIQGLNQRLTEELKQKETDIAELNRRNKSLEQRLDAIEEIICNRNSN